MILDRRRKGSTYNMRKESLNETSFFYEAENTGNYFEDDVPCCSILIIPGNKIEEDYLRNIFSRITAPSPVWKESVEIDTCSSFHAHHSNNNSSSSSSSSETNTRQQTDCNNNTSTISSTKHVHITPKAVERAGNSQNTTKTKTQSLSVNFILREEHIGNEVHNIRRLFLSKPWSFHHTFQTFDMERQKVVAKQPYYELTEEYPLLSPTVCHKGSSVLRYNVFVKGSFQDMKNFYACLLRSQPMYEEENFCYFTIYSKNGAEIQLSLKQSKQLNIVPTKRTFLKIQLDNVYESVHELGAKIEGIFCSDCGVLVTHDPEGNPLLVTGKPRSGPTNSPQATPQSTLSRKTRKNSVPWSDCSTGCSECFRNVDRNMYRDEHDDSGYYNDSSYCNDSSYYNGSYYNDSGYHNDDVSSDDDYEPPYNTTSRSYRRRYRNKEIIRNKLSKTNSRYGNQHDTECTNKVLYDSLGREYTCCVAYV